MRRAIAGRVQPPGGSDQDQGVVRAVPEGLHHEQGTALQLRAWGVPGAGIAPEGRPSHRGRRAVSRRKPRCPCAPGSSGAGRRPVAGACGGVPPARRPRNDLEAGRGHQMEAGRETILMQATFKVSRYDPEAGGKPSLQPYTLELPEDATVLDGLFKIREELDGSLAFRASCNRGFCGECTLWVRPGGRFAWLTRGATARTKDGEVTVEPIRSVRVVKELGCDSDQSHWQKIKAADS